MAYSAVGSLLLGDMQVSSKTNVTAYVEDAASEIDSIIGVRYKTPIDTAEATTVLAHHSVALLRKLNNHLASGRLIMAEAIGGEDTSVHAYGVFMVRSALRELQQIANGEIDLDGAEEWPDAGGDDTTGPSVANEDATAGVAAFYDEFMRAPGTSLNPPVWSPGH